MRPGVFAKAADRLNLLKPEFVMCVGDLIEGYTKDEAQLEEEWSAFDAIVDRLDMRPAGCVRVDDLQSHDASMSRR